MKAFLACAFALTACTQQAHIPATTSPFPVHQSPKFDMNIDDTSRFIFFSVLEGLYTDGLQDDELDMLLLRPDPKEGYTHFIYGCPICIWSIRAMETYRQRPERFYAIKNGASNFGTGLEPELRRKLLSDDTKARLEVLNSLITRWIEARIKSQNLSMEAREVLRKDLKKKRQDGESLLQRFRKEGILPKTSAYATGIKECAACNGALGMKLPERQKSPQEAP